MKKILVLTGSNHSNSMNVQVAKYAANKLTDSSVSYWDMTQVDFPMYGIDFEQANGIPQAIQDKFNQLQEFDGYLIASPEHNGNVPAVFKNFIDWMTRVNRNFLGNKPTMTLTASPGPGAGQSVRTLLNNSLPHFGGNVVSSFGLPSFGANFSAEGIPAELETTLNTAVESFENTFVTETL